MDRAEADTAKMEADKERAEANVAKAVAEKEQAEAEGAAKELKLRNELETLRQASGSDSRELEARLNAANAALKVENEGLSRQLFELKADGADRIESEKALATASLTAQLAKSQQEIAALIEAKDLLERGPEDEEEATADAAQIRRRGAQLTAQARSDAEAAAKETAANTALALGAGVAGNHRD